MEKIPKIIFIVPYRDREHEKHHFSVYMKYILEDLDPSSYEIYFSHQNDKRPFNRGATKNIGFLVAKKKYPNHYKNISFVFNDIDTIPIKKNTFNYETTPNNVKHFYGFKYALGGIVSITGQDFEKCNGFPNNWGWGLEDNTLNDRCIRNKINIDRKNFYNIGDKNIIHILGDPNREINNNEVGYYKNKQLYDNLNTIKNLNYIIEKDILNTNIININNFTTLISHNSGKYYTQNLKQTTLISVDKFSKRNKHHNWRLKF